MHRHVGEPRWTDRCYQYGLWLAYRLLLVFWFLFRPNRRGAFVAVWHAGRILVIRNSYRNWEALPAGGVKRGEEPRETAVRELREEVGMCVQPSDLRFVAEISTSFEFKRDHCSFFELELENKSEPPSVIVDRREVISAGFVSVDEARQARLAPPVRTYLERRIARP